MSNHNGLSADQTQPALQPLAPLPGHVCIQYICCRKPGCRCRTGERHGPYYYRVWREGRRVQKAYVKQCDVEAVRAACAAHKQMTASLHVVQRERERLTRSISREWCKTKRLLLQVQPFL